MRDIKLGRMFYEARRKVWRYRNDSVITRSTRDLVCTPRNFKSKGSVVRRKDMHWTGGCALSERVSCSSECDEDLYCDSPSVMLETLTESDYFAYIGFALCNPRSSNASQDYPIILSIRLQERSRARASDVRDAYCAMSACISQRDFISFREINRGFRRARYNFNFFELSFKRLSS